MSGSCPAPLAWPRTLRPIHWLWDFAGSGSHQEIVCRSKQDVALIIIIHEQPWNFEFWNSASIKSERSYKKQSTLASHAVWIRKKFKLRFYTSNMEKPVVPVDLLHCQEHPRHETSRDEDGSPHRQWQGGQSVKKTARDLPHQVVLVGHEVLWEARLKLAAPVVFGTGSVGLGRVEGAQYVQVRGFELYDWERWSQLLKYELACGTWDHIVEIITCMYIYVKNGFKTIQAPHKIVRLSECVSLKR